MAKTNVGKPKKRNLNRMAYLFVLPFVIVFLTFSVYPVFRTLYLSFTSYKGFGDAKWAGLANYIRVFKDKFFWKALGNTVKIWGVNIILQLGLAFLLTVIFSDIKYKIRGLGIFRAVYYLPNLIAATSVAFLFKTLLDWKYGSFNQLLLTLGVAKEQINWFHVHRALRDLGDRRMDVVWQFLYHADGGCAGHSDGLFRGRGHRRRGQMEGVCQNYDPAAPAYYVVCIRDIPDRRTAAFRSAVPDERRGAEHGGRAFGLSADGGYVSLQVRF